MPYSQSHRSARARARIIDLEIKKLELRRSSGLQAPRPGGEARPIDRRASSSRPVA
jgi:hypothetical protein